MLYFDNGNAFNDPEMTLFWLKIGDIAIEANGVLDF